MKLTELGERKIIKIFEGEFRKTKCRHVALGIGDDAAVLDLGKGVYLVASCDAIYQKTHIPREMTAVQIGKFAVNVFLSDIAAMGASPLGLLLSFGIPRSLEENFVKKIAKAINNECRRHGICILGGDTKECNEIAISGTALGIARKRKWLEKRGAKIGDAICITGETCSAAAGFRCLNEGLKIAGSIKTRLIKKALEPKARIREGLILSKYASSCTDISDGLAFSLHEIAGASGAGFRIYESKIPVNKYAKIVSKYLKIPVREMMLHEGGDYGLLFTARRENLEAIRKEMKKIGTKIYEIGVITKEGRNIIDLSGKEKKLDSRGYEAFK